MHTRCSLVFAAAAAMLVNISPAAASTTTLEPSQLGVPTATPLTLAYAATATPADVEMLGVRYRPRYRPRYRDPDYYESPRRSRSQGGVSQIHAGFFDPHGDQESRLNLGIRGGPVIDRNIHLGLGLDWIHKQENVSTVTTTTVGPGGVPIEVRQDIARASVNMFPIMGFLQVQGAEMGAIPYFGIAGGYEVLLLAGDDFQTGESFEGTFSGWGWQLWGGIGFPLSGRTRLNGEVYWNGAELGRDVTDPNTGQDIHETVNADGMGARFGLAWGF
jgi:hypothetical protein